MVVTMSEGPAQNRFDAIVNKWRILVEKRRDHLVELHMSGRWSTYYEEQDFKRSMREAADAVERWAAVAPRPLAETERKSPIPSAPPRHRGIV
jgi:uncharacterized repeat protein (TIGR03809 family)